MQLLEQGGSLSLPPLPSFSDSTSSIGDDDEHQSTGSIEPRVSCEEDIKNLKVR